MQKVYCTECTQLEEHPVMVETSMDSGEYIQNGIYWKCKKTGRIFSNITWEQLDFNGCMEGEKKHE